MSSEEGVYLFGVIKAANDIKLDKVKLDGRNRQTYKIEFKEHAMIAADAPLKIYEPDRENLKAHQSCVADLMEQTTVIPMSFGNTLQTKKDVKVLLERLYGKFEKIFPKIENKIEVGLKIIANKDWMSKEAGDQSELAAIKKNLKEKKGPVTHYDQIQAGEAAEKFIKGIHLEFDQEVFRPLASISDAAKSNEVIGERMLLNASFLVDRDNEVEFDRKVNEFYEKWKDKAHFKYTGPWPAYNFIDVKIKAEDAS